MKYTFGASYCFKLYVKIYTYYLFRFWLNTYTKLYKMFPDDCSGSKTESNKKKRHPMKPNRFWL